MLALQLYFFPLILFSPPQLLTTTSTPKSCSLEKTFISLLVTILEGLIFPLLSPAVLHPFLDQPVQEKVFISPLACPSSIV
jgi:hypothetical protein